MIQTTKSVKDTYKTIPSHIKSKESYTTKWIIIANYTWRQSPEDLHNRLFNFIMSKVNVICDILLLYAKLLLLLLLFWLSSKKLLQFIVLREANWLREVL